MKKELKAKYYSELTAKEQNAVIKKIINKKYKGDLLNNTYYDQIKAYNIKSFVLNWLTVEQALNF